MKIKNKLLQYIEGMKGIANTKVGNECFHPEGDAFIHTKQVAYLARQRYFEGEYSMFGKEIIMAAMLHDIGKAIKPIGHAKIGASMIEEVIKDRTNYGQLHWSLIIWLVANHMQPKYFWEMKWTKLEKHINHTYFKYLMRLKKLDMDGRKPDFDPDLDFKKLFDLCIKKLAV